MSDDTPLQVTPEMLVSKVLADNELMETINANPQKVMLSPDGTEAELSIGEILPPIVLATVKALADLEVITFTQPEQPPVG